jgi:hypothetical protein
LAKMTHIKAMILQTSTTNVTTKILVRIERPAPANDPSQNRTIYTKRRFRDRASLEFGESKRAGSDIRAAYGVVIIALGISLAPELAAC